MTDDVGDTVQVVMFGDRFLAEFDRWLRSRGASRFRIPIDDPDDLPTYGIRPLPVGPR